MKVYKPGTEFRFAHWKRDGHMMRIRKDSNGIMTSFTKSFSEVDLTWHPMWRVLIKTMPLSSEICCELWKPGELASYISTGLAQKDTKMHLDVFAVPRGLPYRLPLPETAVEVRRWGIDFIPFFDKEDNPMSEGPFEESKLIELGSEALIPDTEGYVFKNSNMGEPFKWKPFNEVSLKVVGIEQGNGKYEGMVGSLVCALEGGRVVANVSGMTDAERREMTENQNSLKGRIAQIKYQYVNTQGRLRHASFHRWRPDLKRADRSIQQ